MNLTYKVVGIAVAPHAVFGHVVVFEFCDGIASTHDLEKRRLNGPYVMDEKAQE